MDLKEIEDIKLEGWTLIEDTSNRKVYQKGDTKKELQLFENYSLEENFTNGQLHGFVIGRMKESFFHYSDGQSKIYLVKRYMHGKQTGVSYAFYDDGAKMEIYWENDECHGSWTEWFGNGQKEKEKNYSYGKQQGACREWYANGQLKLEENFIGGIKHGLSIKYLESGLLKRKQTYQKGKVQGIVYTLWDFKGKVVDGGLYSESEYKDDLMHGKDMVFYSNGKKMREGSCENGLEHGQRTWWNANGNISIKENYQNGELHGERFLYDDNGSLESVQTYCDGERLS